MAIMLLPDQVPRFWEVIKFAVVKVELIKEDVIDRYLNRLLYQLLSGKTQCFIRLSADRRLQMIGLTSISEDPIRDENTLFCYALFSFEKVGPEVWKEDFKALIDWAKANKCKSITTWSNNERAVELLKSVGMRERFKMLYCEVGGE